MLRRRVPRGGATSGRTTCGSVRANRRSDFSCDFFSACSIAPTRAERDRQRDFNVALLDLVSDLRTDIGRIRDDLKRDIETVQRDVRVADEALAEELRKIRELIPIAAKRNDSLIAALDQKIETVAVRVRDVTNPVVASSAASDFLYRRLEDGLRGRRRCRRLRCARAGAGDRRRLRARASF